MSNAHRLAYDLHNADLTIEDPGAGGTIVADRLPGICRLTLASSIETRTLAAPTKTGQLITVTNPANTCYLAYNTSETLILDRADETVVFQAVSDSAWKVIVGPGGDATSVVEGFGSMTALTASQIDDDTDISFGVSDDGAARSLTLAELKKTGVQVFNVLQHGADPTGVADNTAAIQAAIDAAESVVVANSYGCVVYLPPGRYALASGLEVAQNGISVVGAGVTSTIISYTGTTGDAITFSKGASSIYSCELRDMYITSTSTSSTKRAVVLESCTGFVGRNVIVNEFTGGDSVGIHCYGHERVQLSNIQVKANVPIRISRDTVTPGVIDCDHFHFSDTYLIASSTAPSTLTRSMILVDSDVYLSNFTLDGSNAWVGGQHGLYYDRTDTVASVTHGLSISNVRTEQHSTAGYAIYLQGNASRQLQQVQLQNIRTSSSGYGVYMRQTVDASLIGLTCAGSTLSLNIDTVGQLRFSGLTSSGGLSSFSLGTMRLIYGSRPYGFGTRNYWSDGLYAYDPTTSNPEVSKPVKFFEVDTWGIHKTVADDGTIQLPVNSDAQFWQMAIIEVMAVNAANQIVEYGVWTAADLDADGSGKKGIAKVSGTTNTADSDSDTDLCVYCTGTNPLEAPVYVKNRLGQSCDVMVIVRGKRSSSGT